jgi:hypothetical protein
MYRKKTLRKLQPITRRYARNLNSLQGILKRLQNLTDDIARLELDSQSLLNRQKHEQAIEHDTSPDHVMEGQVEDYFNIPEDER